MTLLRRLLRALFGPKPHPALEPVLRVRRMYLEQMQQTANLAAALTTLARHLIETADVVARWERRASLPLPPELHVEAQRILARYSGHLRECEALQSQCCATLEDCTRTQEELLSQLTMLGSEARRLGLDTRSLAVEINLDAVEQSAIERNALALVETGIDDSDEELAFLDKLFERGLENRPGHALH